MMRKWLARTFGLPCLMPERKADPDPQLFAVQGNEKLLLHVGCGRATLADLPEGFHPGWREVRVDLDPAVAPDLVASFTNLSVVPPNSVDALFTSHTIEHLYWFEVPQALAECRRVLRDDGFLLITCPDLQAAAAMIAEDRIDEIAYHSPAGPITPFDLVFSYRPFVAENPHLMSHKCGFTLRTLSEAVRAAGFPALIGMRRPAAFDLWLLATPQPRPEGELRQLAQRYLPGWTG